MSTRSRIAIKNDDNTYKSVYCHHDGYPDYNGNILVKNYTTKEKVLKLMENGDMSSLGEKIGDKQNFDKPVVGTCVFYGRDRGETEVKARHTKTLNELFEVACNDWAEYLYIFENNQWTCYNNKKKVKFT